MVPITPLLGFEQLTKAIGCTVDLKFALSPQKDKASDLPFGCCQQKGERRYLEKDTMELRLRAEKLILLN